MLECVVQTRDNVKLKGVSVIFVNIITSHICKQETQRNPTFLLDYV